ncbi:hypothetical protein BaRGS_00011980 [Batillaria attramentaria]|uniref:Cation efflux protein cytoplasmic domain-containing protein n=1 Tax=Batillaria attramentaria TaxID=370345 RepID=A0ABD0LCB8_9CAEN
MDNRQNGVYYNAKSETEPLLPTETSGSHGSSYSSLTKSVHPGEISYSYNANSYSRSVKDEMIKEYEDLRETRRKDDDHNVESDYMEHQSKIALRWSQVTLFINLLLLAAKTAAAVLSGSLAIISSLIDSAVDLLSGIIMWWATRAMRNRDPYLYPQGRTKLEPVAIIILSTVMALASAVFIRECVTALVGLLDDSDATLPSMEISTFVIVGSTVVIKFILWIICRRVKSSIVQALALDHRNDVCSNTVAIVCGYLGSQQFQNDFDLDGFKYVDPAGAILISLYTIYNWWQMGAEQIKLLTGRTATPEFLSKVTWMVLDHDENIRHIETVRAFHSGNNFLVEVDIVLPETMPLGVAHDIGERLQQKLESLPEVERAFVHLDYDFTHTPKMEHKEV